MRAVAFMIRIVLLEIICYACVVGATPLSYEFDKSLIVHDDMHSGKTSQEKVFSLFKEKAHRDDCRNTQGHNYAEARRNYRSAGSSVVLKRNMNRSLNQKSKFQSDSTNSFPDLKSPIAVEDQEYVLSSRYGNIPFIYGLLKHGPPASGLTPVSYSGHYMLFPMAVASSCVHNRTRNIKQVYRKDHMKPSVHTAENLGRISNLAWSELIHDTIMPNILPTMPIPFTRQRDYGVSHYNSPLLSVFPKKVKEYAVPLETWPTITSGRLNPHIHEYSYNSKFEHVRKALPTDGSTF
ncbi:hypothetical protein EVAR_83564_1 [Eumeta japonica]|uniref:Uncharacterized protein n=1 Tax=Eumeta variegata TaxID=151549 RepID=A0A4C1UND4_EUMVA|nr:hypothetical protein EVAR_83564_1 [Eumeta japonica]